MGASILSVLTNSPGDFGGHDKILGLAQGVINYAGCEKGKATLGRHCCCSRLKSVPSNSCPPGTLECDCIWKKVFADVIC